MGLLSDIRVLDLSLRLPGPFCTLLMADHGADVITVIDPSMRGVNPFAEEPGLSAYERYLNRGKRSLTLDLKADIGKAIIRQLAATCDVVVEGFRPGVAARLGVDAETLRAANPRLVYCSITGYGQDGPRAMAAGHDINFAAWSGVLGLNGPGGGAPEPMPVQVADLFGGAMMAVTSILMALHARQRTGQGATLDVSMTDGALSLLSIHAAERLAGGDEPARGEMPLSGQFPCYDVYRCADGGYLAIAALEPVFWERLLRVLDREDLRPGQFAMGDDGQRARAEFEAIFATRTRDAWMAILGPADACVSPVLSLGEALDHPFTRDRGMIVDVALPAGGVEPQLATPFRCDGTRPAPSGPVRPGAHDDAILSSLGYDAGAIAAMRRDGVIRG